LTSIEASRRRLQIEDFEEFLAAQQERSTAYEPREDTFLLLEALTEISLERSRVLEIGTGSGILAAYCARRGPDVTASDIDADAIRVLRLVSDRLGTHLRLVVSDLFSDIDDRFDLVLFNPPYLPSDRTRDPAVDGGSGGIRIISGFLNQLPAFGREWIRAATGQLTERPGTSYSPPGRDKFRDDPSAIPILRKAVRAESEASTR